MLLGNTHIERFNTPEKVWSFSSIAKAYSACDQITTTGSDIEQVSLKSPGKVGIDELS